MENIFFKICEKILVGGYVIKIKKKYIEIPKIGPFFFSGMITSSIGEIVSNYFLIYSGWFILLISIFGYFYYNIFPNRRPKNDGFF